MPRETNADLLARIDERTKNMEEQLATACIVLLGNGHPEQGLAARFDRHAAEPHLHKLARSRIFWALMVFAIVFGNVIVRVGWPWVRALAGLLGLPLPA